MKKLTGVLIVAFCLGMAMPAQAQIKLGIKGGLNLASSLSDTWENKAHAESYTGFHIGPMLDIRIPIVGLGVDGALMYSQKGYKMQNSTIKQSGIEVPLNLKYSIGLGDFLGVYFAAGPSFFFNMADDKILDIGNTDGVLKLKKSEVSINLGAGVKLINHIQLGVNYNIPVTDSGKLTPAEGNTGGAQIFQELGAYKTKMWQVSVAYIF